MGVGDRRLLLHGDGVHASGNQTQRDGERRRETQRDAERRREAQRDAERRREAQRGAERRRETERGAERRREAQRDAERRREAQRDAERRRETERDAERRRETQRDAERRGDVFCSALEWEELNQFKLVHLHLLRGVSVSFWRRLLGDGVDPQPGGLQHHALCSCRQPGGEPLVLPGLRDGWWTLVLLWTPPVLLQQQPGTPLLQPGRTDRSGLRSLLHAGHRHGGLLLPSAEGVGVRHRHVGQRDRHLRAGAGGAAAHRPVLVEGCAARPQRLRRQPLRLRGAAPTNHSAAGRGGGGRRGAETRSRLVAGRRARRETSQRIRRRPQVFFACAPASAVGKPRPSGAEEAVLQLLLPVQRGVPLPAAAGLPGPGLVLAVPGQRLQRPLRLPGAVRTERRRQPPSGRLPHVHRGSHRHRGEHHLRLADGPQVSEAVSYGVLHHGGWYGGSLLSLRAAAQLLHAPRALRRPLRLLRRRLRGADPRGDVRRGGSSVPVLGAGRGLLPPRHPLPGQPANRRLAD
ncbi:uncharacterized protein LOC141758608 isoform X1 [Sebastes fasciatus]|uniref:uncharacterized protein LOC141758608 isoform X1 n=1 Tax=Sebastes fasciatus TaxID=394691 RepID=UPI003D9EC2FA